MAVYNFGASGWSKTGPEGHRIAKAFRDSPSLRPCFVSIYADCYATARQKASVETGLPLEIFPQEAPFPPEAALDTGFLPD
ncbi:DUF29 family protein [Leptolyngbya sp. CCNP1308]|uniref:DUF29 family protein n=1 Tax=Leptolyngbya sp. CCNP1308 TaxID=3110255 RepID=UPI003A599BEE